MVGFIQTDTNSKSSLYFNSENSNEDSNFSFSSEASDPCASGVIYIRPHPVRGGDMWQYSRTGSGWSNIGSKAEGDNKVGIIGTAEERVKSKAGAAGWALWSNAQSCITPATVCSSNTSGGIVIFKSGNKFGMLNSSSKLLGWENSLNEAKLNVGGNNKCYIDRTSTSAVSNVTKYDYNKFINEPEFYTTGEGSQAYTPPTVVDGDIDTDDEPDIQTLTEDVTVVESTKLGIPMPVLIGVPIAILGVLAISMKK